ncbi:MAG: Uma2 family endonuclease [Myxococcota bacterium]
MAETLVDSSAREERWTALGPPRRLRADEVLRMVEAGLLEDERVELLDGVLYPVSPQGPEHAASTVWLRELLQARYGRAVCCYDHSSFHLDGVSLPEPDLALVRGSVLDYRGRLPRPGDVVMLVEISQTSQRRDRAKAALYASGAVPVYWRLDLPSATLEVFEAPESGAYTRRRVYGDGDLVPLPERADTLAVSELLRASRLEPAAG